MLALTLPVPVVGIALAVHVVDNRQGAPWFVSLVGDRVVGVDANDDRLGSGPSIEPDIHPGVTRTRVQRNAAGDERGGPSPAPG